MGLVTVTIKVEDDVAAPIDGVVCRVFTDPADAFVTQGTTGNPTPGSGEAEVTLNGDVTPVPYFVRLSKDGVSFLPSATVNIAVKDPPPPPNLFTFVGTIGETDLVVQIVVKDDQGTPQPVEGVQIRVYDAIDDFVTELVTDAAGQADVVLNGAPDPGLDYFVRFFKSGWRFTNGTTQVIRVQEPLVPPATNIFDIEATVPSIPESIDPSMCLISGILTNVSKQPIKGATLVFLPRLTEPDAKVSGFPFPTKPVVVDSLVLVSEVKAKANDSGYVEVLLPRTSIFDVHLHGLETPGSRVFAQVFIPDRLGAKLEDVLFPFVASVDMEVGAVGLDVGEVSELTFVAIGSNDQNLDGSLAALVELTSSDSDVAAASIGNDGTVFVTGISSGTATITVSRIANTWAPRVPAIPALVITPAAEITVTVT